METAAKRGRPKKVVASTPDLTPEDAPILPKAPKEAKPKKRQYELSQDDVKLLGQGMGSKAAWKQIAMRHGFDPETVEWQPEKYYNSQKVPQPVKCPPTFYAVPKDYRQELFEIAQKKLSSNKTSSPFVDSPIAIKEEGSEVEEEVEV